MNNLIKITLISLLMVLASCNSEPSLQEYYIDHKETENFVAVDIPTSLIAPDTDMLTEEQKKVVNSVRKVNVLAYPLKNGDKATYDDEKAQLAKVLKGDDYEELMTFGQPSQKMTLYLKGEEEAIDEVIFFGHDDEKGFVVARVLGEDMNISEIIRFAENMDTDGANINTAGLKGVMDIFDQ
ncbi:MAG: DUF4252 domain-containing protein [Leeuwenhoekiella sp.]